jgi:hypothetical protein
MRAYCECPRCRRTFPVKWGWTTLKVACLRDDDGEVVTDRDCLYATRVTYPRHVRCPHCGVRLAAQHELWPRFFAVEEGKQYADGAR